MSTGDRPFSWLVILFMALSAPLAAVQAREMVVWGRVVSALTGAAISGAVVTVTPAERRPQLTDAQGRFLFRLSAGGYRLSVTKVGYFFQLPWDSAMGEPAGALLDVTANSSTALTIPLWPSTDISGTVYDEGQRSLAGITVRAEPTPRYTGTRQQLVAVTDDRGQYRISDIRPGSYLVGARVPFTVAVRPRQAGESRPEIDSGLAAMRDRVPVLDLGGWFVQVPPTSQSAGPIQYGATATIMVARPIYYSDTRDPSSARVLTLRPGQTLDAIDFQLPLEVGYGIRGTVNAEGLPRSGFQVVAVLWSSSEIAASPAVMVASSTSDERGQFFLAGVPNGTYHVVAFSPRPVGAAPPLRDVLWAETEVDVHASDVKDINLSLASLPPFDAVVSSVGESPVPLAAPLVSLRMEADPSGLPAGPGLVRFAPDTAGRLNLSQLVPGEYATQVTPPSGWVVHSLLVNGRLAIGRAIRRSSRSASVLRINLTSEYGSALVSVRPNTAGANGSRVVVLFPTQRETWGNALHDIDRFRLIPVDSAGRAEFTGVLPGDYLTAAINTDRPGLVWRDRRVLERLALQASVIHVSAHAQASAIVTAIPE